MEVVVSTMVSVPTGILTSFVFWWWLTRRLAPRLAWSRELVIPPAGTTTGTDHDQPRVKTVNLGRRDVTGGDRQRTDDADSESFIDFFGSVKTTIAELEVSDG